MPVDINRLTEGWLELESDPGLFTLLLEDFGVKGVQVEEIYDLQKSIEGPVYGFIFLFRWIEERRSRRKVVDQSESFVKDEDVVNNIFFAQQMVPNSCATHALLSVLLNCSNIHLGATLSRLKAHTSGMCPENKGWAIGNTPELAKAHNSHAMPQAKRRLDKSTGVSTGRYTGEAFHFVSYVPIRGRLFELDGLKPFPMDHGPWGDKEDWTEKFRRVIKDRLGIATGEPYHDIRFNLMAVVPDKRLALTHKLKMLKTNRQIVLEALQQLVKLTHPELTNGKDEMETGDEKKELEGVSASSVCENVKKDLQKNGESEKIKLNGTHPSVPEGNSPKNSASINLEGKNKDCSLSDSDSYLTPHPILETHNYAKIPLIASTDPNNSSLAKAENSLNTHVEGLQDKSTSAVAAATTASGTMLCPPDYSTPLTIQTSPAPSSSSTDTSSEVGSAFNSPTQGWGWNSGQSSPTSSKDFKKLVVIRMAGAGSAAAGTNTGTGHVEDKAESPTGRSMTGLNANCKRVCTDVINATKKVCLEGGQRIWEKEAEKTQEQASSPISVDTGSAVTSHKKVDTKLCSKYPELFEPHTFAPKDLLALLKNLENEISVCEVNLRDENDKRKKYKIDDCRRTHNYDEFICTFLSMLAQQGKLADLVQQHLVQHKKPGLPVPRVQRPTKKPEPRPNPSRRRRGRTKYRKRK
ncbi:ubiquitin carboxyl-terminal hydrolase calypso [Zootermopsis nevadensis]|uniref:Ubiquitin carboxyl-terminal hydrolase n=1 Tax=Zootermopsis nevadensis TaxID=136037 RepID=A0A067RLX3_ZOONE|nr:ubiquitin carboxyl-terminal hydrolase calypso [Zootermopsis nevadensis]KDR20573.1 Ubiquitin carboxyl-terminal hydrolase BAP1 [Zootermopsis nevadensis]